MQLLALNFERYFHINDQRHVFAEELKAKIQRMRECFAGNALPLPSAEVRAVWRDVPNVMVNTLPMKTGLSLAAPPPTPTGIAFDMDDAPTNDTSPLSDSQNKGWVFVENTDTPTPGVAALPMSGSTFANDDSMSQSSVLDPCPDKQIAEEESHQPSDSDTRSPSSDRESDSSGCRTSSTPVGFYNMVNQWFLDYRARGTESFVESLIAFGVVSLGTAPLASRVGHDVIRRVGKMSYVQGKDLESTLRFSALTSFKNYWNSNDFWMETSPTPYGIHIASFIGSLFDAKISTVKDVHLCLSYLLEGEKRFERLCAMHALLVQANDKLCKSRNLAALMQFKNNLLSKDEDSGKYLWDTSCGSKTILNDILAMIDRWMVLQSLKRDRSRASSGNCTFRNRSVGPRLRSGPPL